MKTCSKCEIEKPLTSFYKRGLGYKSHCKECSSIYGKNYYTLNKDSHNEKMSKHYIDNKENYRKTNKIYKEKNKEKVNKIARLYNKKKRDEDILFKLKHNLRVRIKEYMKTKSITSKNKTFDFVGCEPKMLIQHIEEQFNDGLSWENYGEWHIDHIIPLSSAKTEEELYKLCHFTNLQPMWALDNIKKGSKIL
jgi:hypothetical protein